MRAGSRFKEQRGLAVAISIAGGPVLRYLNGAAVSQVYGGNHVIHGQQHHIRQRGEIMPGRVDHALGGQMARHFKADRHLSRVDHYVIGAVGAADGLAIVGVAEDLNLDAGQRLSILRPHRAAQYRRLRWVDGASGHAGLHGIGSAVEKGNRLGKAGRFIQRCGQKARVKRNGGLLEQRRLGRFCRFRRVGIRRGRAVLEHQRQPHLIGCVRRGHACFARCAGAGEFSKLGRRGNAHVAAQGELGLHRRRGRG